MAGDVAHKNDIIEPTLQLCVERFAAVFYCPGNHDLWVRAVYSYPHCPPGTSPARTPDTGTGTGRFRGKRQDVRAAESREPESENETRGVE